MPLSKYDLIKRPVNTISYEHCVVQYLYPEHYIGDAERNYYVGCGEEINLCVHYTFRVPGKYEFIPTYRYYRTNGRCSLKLHHSLGQLDERKILEQHESLEEAQSSEYYQDFCDLKKKIDEEIKSQTRYRKTLEQKPEPGIVCCCKSSSDDELYLYEGFVEAENKFVQFYGIGDRDIHRMSTSKYPIKDMYCYLDDFRKIMEAMFDAYHMK